MELRNVALTIALGMAVIVLGMLLVIAVNFIVIG
jgi:hypothetical protein